MKDSPNVSARRTLLGNEVQKHGQAEIGRRAQKPDRQIGDLIAGRVSFGDRVAKDIERIRPDLPQGWLVFAEQTIAAQVSSHSYPTETAIAEALAARESQLSYQLQEITKLWVKLSPEQRDDELSRLRVTASAACSPAAELSHKNDVKSSNAKPGENEENPARHRPDEGSLDLWKQIQAEKKKTPGGKPGVAK